MGALLVSVQRLHVWPYNKTDTRIIPKLHLCPYSFQSRCVLQASDALLFLKNLRSIALYVRKEGESAPQLLYRMRLSMPNVRSLNFLPSMVIASAFAARGPVTDLSWQLMAAFNR